MCNKQLLCTSSECKWGDLSVHTTSENKSHTGRLVLTALQRREFMPHNCMALLLYLIRIHKEELVHSQREEHVEEQNLIAPNDPLLFCLLVKPTWPFILHQLILETILLCHIWNEFLQQTHNDVYVYNIYVRILWCIFTAKNNDLHSFLLLQKAAKMQFIIEIIYIA